MRGVVTKHRFGIMPRFLLNMLLKENIVSFNLKHKPFTYILGYMIHISDSLRENIAKPIYRNILPVKFKVWFDKARYRI